MTHNKSLPFVKRQGEATVQNLYTNLQSCLTYQYAKIYYFVVMLFSFSCFQKSMVI